MTKWLLGSNGEPAIWVAGDENTLTVTLGGSGSISGGTPTVSVSAKGGAVLAGPFTMTVSDAANRVVTYTFTEANTALFSTNSDPTIRTEHIFDVKLVLGTVTTHNNEEVHFLVRAPRTA